MADDFDEDAVDDWSMRTWGQAPMEITHWSSFDGVHEVLLKYSTMVAILRLKAGEDNVLATERQVAIRVEEWNPGSVQANRLSDGTIKLRFRRQNMTLSAMMKTPHALSSLLEEWLMSMRGSTEKNRDQAKRIQAVKRNRDAVSRMLEQASIGKLVEAQDKINQKITHAEDTLTGNRSA
ncbi:hypothetical protein OAJ94_03605 [Deltaproteobacteria bacterium]|nr:hypothetical protein [Deltaproteobacteria bacterium]